MSNFDEIKLSVPPPPPYPGLQYPESTQNSSNVHPIYPGSYPNATSTPIPPRNVIYPNSQPVQAAYVVESCGHGNGCYYVDGRRPRAYIVVSNNYRRHRAMYGGLIIFIFFLPLIIFLIIFYSTR